MNTLFQLLLKSRFIRERVARNLRQPEDTFIGRLVTQKLKENNSKEELNAVKQLNIQPSDHVLEVGFGPGLGLQYASTLLQADAGGQLYGVDISEPMYEEAEQLMFKEISQGLVHLYLNSVDNLPFNSHTIDKIYHCNCFYFWPDVTAACKELLRILKPTGLMVTTLQPKGVAEGRSSGLLVYGKVDTLQYLTTLEHVGFIDVHVQHKKDEESSHEYLCIYATAPD